MAVTTIPSREMWHRWRDFLIVVPWGELGLWTVAGSRLYVGVSNRPEVRVYKSDGMLRQIVRWRERPRPVTVRDREALARRRERFLPEVSALADVLPPLREFPRIPEEKPLFLSLLGDDEGRVWVREYPDFVAGSPGLFDVGGELGHRIDRTGARDVWKVFGAAGRFDGLLNVPADRHILAIERGHAVTLEIDEHDMEFVRLYRIRRTGGTR